MSDNGNGNKNPEGLSNKTNYLLDRPSDEAVSSRKKNEEPFQVSITRDQYRDMQKAQKANLFHERLDEAGIKPEMHYNPAVHSGYYRGMWRDESSTVCMMIFHKDNQILHDLMEEFVNRKFIKEFSWKVLKNLYVN